MGVNLIALCSISQNVGKSSTDCLEILVNRLAEIQDCLPKEYRNDTIFKKLLNAVKNVESCRPTYQKPAESLQGIISDLHASIATGMKTQSHDPSALYVDRR